MFVKFFSRPTKKDGTKGGSPKLSMNYLLDKPEEQMKVLVGNPELSTGKRLQPYYDRADKHLAEGFKQVINLQYGLSSPDDPQKRQTVTINKNLPKTSKATVEAVNELIRDGFENGEVSNRQEVIAFLEKYGFEIARQTEKFISIKNENGRNIRLKGAFYEQSFGVGGESQEAERTRKAGKEGVGSLRSQEEHRELYQQAEAALARSVEKRRAVFSKQFARGKTDPSGGARRLTEADRELTQRFGQEIHNPVLGASGSNGFSGNGEYLHWVGGKEPISADGGLEEGSRAIQDCKQGNGYSKLHNARQDNQVMRENRSELSRPRMGGQYENNSKESEIDGSSYKALKGSIERFRRETEQRVEAIKREIKQAAEVYRKIAGRKSDIAELAREVIGKFRIKLQKQAHEKEQKEQKQSRGMGL